MARRRRDGRRSILVTPVQFIGGWSFYRFWAFIYNSIGIPVAALGYLKPIIAVAAMALSSLSVVANSATLKTFKIEME